MLTDDAKSFAEQNNLAFIETSAMDSTNVDVRQLCTRAARTLHRTLPSSASLHLPPSMVGCVVGSLTRAHRWLVAPRRSPSRRS